MKISLRQILASAAGAVAAAVIASFFGVAGTVIGVAIGSIVATTLTTLVAQSIERGHQAVRQEAVKNPDAPILRRFGETGTAGTPNAGAPTATGGAVVDETFRATETIGAPDAATEVVGSVEPVIEAAGPAGEPTVTLGRAGPRTETMGAVPPGRPVPPAPSDLGSGEPRWRIRWPVLVASTVVVFVVALVVVPCIELLAGKPLSSVVGSGRDTGGVSVAPTSGVSTTTSSSTS